MLKKVLLSLSVLLFLVFIFLIYLGAFKQVEIKEQAMGPYYLVYQENTGSYTPTGKIIEKVFNELQEKKIDGTKGFGIFYDDPKTTEKSIQRSEAGCVVSREDYNKLTQTDSLKLKEFKEQKCLVATFPYRNFLSIYLGILKVYPAFNNKLEELKIKRTYGFEIYDKKTYGFEIYDKKTITYIMPLEDKADVR